MTYHVLPCREYREPGSAIVHVERPREHDETEYWGVYLRGANDRDQWTADFATESEARAYCAWRNHKPAKRLDTCRICLDGASNQRRVAQALVDAIDECRAEGADSNSDPLVHGILSQVNNVLGCSSLIKHRTIPNLFERAYALCYAEDDA